jgi:hypothetical protein
VKSIRMWSCLGKRYEREPLSSIQYVVDDSCMEIEGDTRPRGSQSGERGTGGLSAVQVIAQSPRAPPLLLLLSFIAYGYSAFPIATRRMGAMPDWDDWGWSKGSGRACGPPTPRDMQGRRWVLYGDRLCAEWGNGAFLSPP